MVEPFVVLVTKPLTHSETEGSHSVTEIHPPHASSYVFSTYSLRGALQSDDQQVLFPRVIADPKPDNGLRFSRNGSLGRGAQGELVLPRRSERNQP